MLRDATLKGATPAFGLPTRVFVLVAALFAEKLLMNSVVDSDRALAAVGLGEMFRVVQHWGLRLLVAFAGAIALLAYWRGGEKLAKANANMQGMRPNFGWLFVHVLAFLAVLVLSYLAFREGVSDRGFVWIITTGTLLGALTVVSAALALAPGRLWLETARSLGILLFYAVVIAVFGTVAGELSQKLWAPCASITFQAVRIVLLPLLPSLEADPTDRILSTDRFAIEILESCSGLEGMALMLAFTGMWLLIFRREYIFPVAFMLVPLGLIAMFTLNVVRIAVLLLIGHFGFPGVAQYGFHSQAGWLAFILAACGWVVFSRKLKWLSTVASGAETAHERRNPATPYVLPLVAILFVGMLTHAVSNGFENLYPLRLLTGAGALWICRKPLAALNWRCSWRGVLVGICVFALWLAMARWLVPAGNMPPALAAMPLGTRTVWMICRLLASIVTVPIAEELGYRGYLMRRLSQEEFEKLSFHNVRWPAVAVTAIIFGLGHGSMWIPGTVAGLAYGAILVRTGRLGEAVAAHATTNALIAASVLLFGRWDLW
jgi:exosortase E/protease (VPEID-CTERM system)